MATARETDHSPASRIAAFAILLVYTALALFPLYLMIVTSLTR